MLYSGVFFFWETNKWLFSQTNWFTVNSHQINSFKLFYRLWIFPVTILLFIALKYTGIFFTVWCYWRYFWWFGDWRSAVTAFKHNMQWLKSEFWRFLRTQFFSSVILILLRIFQWIHKTKNKQSKNQQKKVDLPF